MDQQDIDSLRFFAAKKDGSPDISRIPSRRLIDAADEIERLRAENERLKASARPVCAQCNGNGLASRSYGFIPCEACDGKGY